MKEFSDFCSLMDTVVAAASETYTAALGQGHDLMFSHVATGADGQPTTWIDDQLEQTCLEILHQHHEIKAVLSEEKGWISCHEKGRYLAILDPLDGTGNAKLGFDAFTLSLCLTDLNHQPQYALVYQYGNGRCYYAGRHEGAWCDGRKMTVSACQQIERSTLLLARPLDSQDAGFYTRLLLQAKRSRIVSCPSLEICLVASGRFEAAIDFHYDGGLIHTHDVIAAKLILEEAGGALLDERGNDLQLPLSCTETFNFFGVCRRDNFQLFSPL